MCTRTVTTLAHALEAAGIATISLLSNRTQAEGVGPPRGLYCEFPVGRPLGKPLDPAFQRGVLDAAFALLPRTDGPLIQTFDVVIEDGADQPLSCPIPPRHDPNEPDAVSEARGLRLASPLHLRHSVARRLSLPPSAVGRPACRGVLG